VTVSTYMLDCIAVDVKMLPQKQNIALNMPLPWKVSNWPF